MANLQTGTIRDQYNLPKQKNTPRRVLLVTPKRASMNYAAKLEELVPFIMAWNGDVSRFLARPRALQQVAVTY